MKKLINIFDLLTISLINKIIIKTLDNSNIYLIFIYCRLILNINVDNNLKSLIINNKFVVILQSKKKILLLKNEIYSFLIKIKNAYLIQYSDNILVNYFIKNLSNQHFNLLLQQINNILYSNNHFITLYKFYECLLKLNKININLFNSNKYILKNYNKYYLKYYALNKFWNNYILKIKSKILLHNIFSIWKTSNKFIKHCLLLNYYILNFKVPLKIKDTLLNIHNNNIKFIKYIKLKLSLLTFDQLKKLIINSDINKHIYNKKNIIVWYNKLKFWVDSNDEYYNFPLSLNYFSQIKLIKESKLNPPKHLIFKFIDKLLIKNFFIKEKILLLGINYINNIYKNYFNNEYEFNLNNKLKLIYKFFNNKEIQNKLIKKILNRYSLIIFNDINYLNKFQFNIIKKIYINKFNSNIIILYNELFCLDKNKLNINNLKFTHKYYVHFLFEILNNKKIYYHISWLFNRINNPLTPYITSFDKNKKFISASDINISLDNIIISGIKYCIYNPGYNISILAYLKQMTKICVLKIYKLLYLGQKKLAYINYKDKKKYINCSDIIIIVNNYNENILIQNELNTLNIPSRYLSNNINIFSTFASKQIYYLLQAILYPHIKKNIKLLYNNNKIFLSYIINNQIYNLYYLLFYYKYLWINFGIVSLINNYLKLYKNKINCSLINDITNILYLSEILQKQEIKKNDPKELLQWLKNQLLNNINNINNMNNMNNINIINENNYIKILNINDIDQIKLSPIVFLPFICNSFITLNQNNHLFKNFIFNNNLLNINNINNKLYKNKLNNNLKLLYHILIKIKILGYLGISPINNVNNKYQTSDLHKCAIGYLLQKNIPLNAIEFHKLLKKNKKNIQIIIYSKILDFNKIPIYPLQNHILLNNIIKFYNNVLYKQTIFFKKFTLPKNKIINFSLINNKLYNNTNNLLLPNFNIKKKLDNYNFSSLHNFPVGIQTGIFFHKIFSTLNFNKIISKNNILELIYLFNFNDKWANYLTNWINKLRKLNLNKNYSNFCLENIYNNFKKIEFKFSFTISDKFTCLLNIINKYKTSTIILNNNLLNFDNKNGIINGKIDLLFKFNKKYYIIDYKSNRLGNNIIDYNYNNLKYYFIKQNFYIQTLLYIIAFNKYLINIDDKYSYNKNFGGFIYLFIRGLNFTKQYNNYGIYLIKPNLNLFYKINT